MLRSTAYSRPGCTFYDGVVLPYPLVRIGPSHPSAFVFVSRASQPFLPSSTRIESRYTKTSFFIRYCAPGDMFLVVRLPRTHSLPKSSPGNFFQSMYMSGGGGAYSFVARLSNSTIDHAPLWRRSTVPTPNRDTSNIWELTTLLPHRTYTTVYVSYVRLVSPSAATIYRVGYRSFSRYCLVYQTIPCHIHVISSSPRIPFLLVYFTSSYYVSPTLYRCATRAHTCSHVLLLLPTTGISLSSFW